MLYFPDVSTSNEPCRVSESDLESALNEIDSVLQVPRLAALVREIKETQRARKEALTELSRKQLQALSETDWSGIIKQRLSLAKKTLIQQKENRQLELLTELNKEKASTMVNLQNELSEMQDKLAALKQSKWGIPVCPFLT